MNSLDISTIRNNYEAMTDAQLITIALEDGHTLTTPAFQVLKEEFLKRRLDEEPVAVAENNRQTVHEEALQKIREGSPEKYEAAIWQYIFEEKEKHTPEKEIIAGLCARAVAEEKANEMLSDTNNKLKEIIAQQDRKASINAFIVLLGLVATFLTYTNASLHGGTYIIAWGAIVFGTYDYFKGASERKKYKKLLATIENPPVA